jgi:hypothetical protein
MKRFGSKLQHESQMLALTGNLAEVTVEISGADEFSGTQKFSTDGRLAEVIFSGGQRRLAEMSGDDGERQIAGQALSVCFCN